MKRLPYALAVLGVSLLIATAAWAEVAGHRYRVAPDGRPRALIASREPHPVVATDGEPRTVQSPPSPRPSTLAGLKLWELAPARSPAARTFLVLHGYGAGGKELMAFARDLGLEDTRFVLPDAPVVMGSGHAWWRFDFEALDHALREGGLDALANQAPPGLAAARSRLDALLAALSRRGAADGGLVVGGFSQGSMVALDWALHARQPPRALVLLSTMPVAMVEHRPLLARLKGVPILMTHGRSDTVLPFVMAERLRAELEAAGASVTWVPFDGGHEVPGEVLPKVAAFLRALPAPAGARGR